MADEETNPFEDMASQDNADRVAMNYDDSGAPLTGRTGAPEEIPVPVDLGTIGANAPGTGIMDRLTRPFDMQEAPAPGNEAVAGIGSAPTVPKSLAATYGTNPNKAAQAAAAGLPTPGVADKLLAGGHISPEAHAAIHDAWGLGGAQNAIASDSAKQQAEIEAANKDAFMANNEQVQAAELKRVDDLKRAQEMGTYDAARQAAVAEHEKAQAEEEARNQQAYNDKRGMLQKLTYDAQQAHVDPEAARGSLGHRAMAAIGIALGTLGSTMGGGPNVALQRVQQEIEQNLDAQKSEIANKWRGVEAGRNDLSDVRDQVKDSRTADDVFRAREIQKRLGYLQSLDITHSPQQIQANHAALVAGLTNQLNQTMHTGTLKGLEADQQSQLHQATIGGERARLSLEQQRLAAEQGKQGALPKDLADSEAQRDSLLSQIDDITSKSGFASGTERARDVQGREETLRADLVKLLGLPERTGLEEVRKHILPGSVTDVSSGADERLKSLRNQIIERTNRKRKEYGLPAWNARPKSSGAPT